jgi:hypothetical protein
MRFTAAEMLADTETASKKINEMLKGVEYIGVGRGIGVCHDRLTANLGAAPTFGEESITIGLKSAGQTVMLITVRADEVLELDEQNKKWHVTNMAVKKCEGSKSE